MHFISKIILLALLFTISLTVQAQNGLNFQGVARNSNNVILASQPISLRLSILQGTALGTVEYSETRKVTTNAQGLFNVVIGDTGAISFLGNFSAINWKLAPKFLKIEMDPTGGNNYLLIGTTQFQSVAYAQFANGLDAENINGIVPVAKGGTGVSSLVALKSALAIDKVAIGLSNVDNTSDTSKPVSTAMQNGLNLKLNAADTIKYTKKTWVDSALITKLDVADTTNLSNRINQKESISNKSSATDLGGISPSDVLFPTQKAVKTYVDAQANASGVADGGITTIKLADAAVTDAKVATGISKLKVGLGNVDNTADIDKPISTAVADALNLKASTNVANVFTERQTINGTLGIIIPNTNNRNWYFDESEQLIFPNNTKIEAGTSTETVIRAPINNDISILTTDGQEHALKFSSSGSLGINSFFEFSSGGDFILKGPNNTEGLIRVASIFGSPDFLNITHDTSIIFGNVMRNKWKLDVQEGILFFPNGSEIHDNGDFELISYSGIDILDIDTTGLNEVEVGIRVANKRVRIRTYDSNRNGLPGMNDWEFTQQGDLKFPDGSSAVFDLEGTGNFGFVLYEDKSFMLETYNTSSDSTFTIEFDKNGKLIFNANSASFGKIFENDFGVSTRGDVGFVITTNNNSHYFKFETNGTLTFWGDGGNTINNNYLPTSANIGVLSNTSFVINYPGSINLENQAGNVQLNENGTLSIPGTIILSSTLSSTLINISPNIEGWSYLQLPNDSTSHTANVRLHNDAGNVEISTGNYYDHLIDNNIQALTNNWYFKKDGRMAFPDGTLTGSDIADSGNFGFDTRQTERGFSIVTAGTSTQTSNPWFFQIDGLLQFPGNGSIGQVYNLPFSFTEALQLKTPNAFVIQSQNSGNYWRFEENGNTVFPADFEAQGRISASSIDIGGNVNVSQYGSFRINNQNIFDKFVTDSFNLDASQLAIFNNNLTFNFTLSATPYNNVAMYLNGSRVNRNSYSISGRAVTFTKSQNETQVNVQFDYIK